MTIRYAVTLEKLDYRDGDPKSEPEIRYFDTEEEARRFFDSIDLEYRWEIEYRTSSRLNKDAFAKSLECGEWDEEWDWFVDMSVEIMEYEKYGMAEHEAKHAAYLASMEEQDE